MLSSISVPNNQLIGGNPQAICDALNATATAAVADLGSLSRKVRVATAASLAAYTAASGVLTANANGAMATVDGVSLAVGDRLLLTTGAAAADNGIYTVTSLGGVSAKYVLTRAADWGTSGVVSSGDLIDVTEGTLYANTTWKLTTTGAITVGTTALSFYPREVIQSITLAAGTVTVTNVPILSATKTGFVFNRITPGSTTTTIMYGPSAAPTPGLVGTASLTWIAQVAAGTIQNTDTSVGNLTIINW